MYGDREIEFWFKKINRLLKKNNIDRDVIIPLHFYVSHILAIGIELGMRTAEKEEALRLNGS